MPATGEWFKPIRAPSPHENAADNDVGGILIQTDQ